MFGIAHAVRQRRPARQGGRRERGGAQGVQGARRPDRASLLAEFSKLTHEPILRGDVAAGPVAAAEVAKGKAASHMPRLKG